MDIHRCRFVPYPPSTINALAFSHSHIAKDQRTASPRLAVGRANGDIEIWNPLKGAWVQETIIRGGQDRSVDELVWIQDPNEEDMNGRTIVGKSRLFSIGYTTTVTEWDLAKGRPLRQASGNHGEIWCLAAQPLLAPSKKETNGTSTGLWEGQYLITGCTDGALVLYSTADDDLQLKRVLVRPSAKKAKIISVTFQDRNFVVAGCTDSTIRVYDIRNGSMVRSMSLGAGPSGGPKEIIVWTVKVLPNRNIISGDSTGELRIWDGKTYTLMQRIRGHRQDILSLATSYDGTVIFSGGMDRRTVVYKLVGGGKSRWAEVAHRRYHDHDVKTMASLEAKGISVVVSGGPDASPMVLPLREFGMENQRALPYLSQEPMLRSSSSKRLMMSWWDREVHIWRLGKHSKPPKSETPAESDDDSEPLVKNRKLVAKILIKGEPSIASAAMSADGSLLAVSTASEIKMFQLRARKVGEGDGLRVSRITLSHAFSTGARLVEFSPDGKWLCVVRDDSRVIVARIVSDGKSTASSIRILPSPSKLERINRQVEKHILLGGLGSYDRTIIRAAFSSDSRILAVSDIAGFIDTWVLSGNEDLVQDLSFSNEDVDEDDDASSTSSSSSDSNSEGESKPRPVFGQHWIRNPSASLLPKLPSTPVVLSFRPGSSSESSSVQTTTNPSATRHNPHPLSHDLPTGEDRLLVVTATSSIFEFSVLQGALTPWSRRNPITSFPEDFRKVKDQARGCIWDVSDGKERVWLHGDGWLWMFDLARDLVVAEPTTDALEQTSAKKSKKRKLGDRSTGAGDQIPDHELGTGMGRKMQRVLHEDTQVIDEGIPLHKKDKELDDAMDIDEDEETALQALRRDDNSADEKDIEKGEAEEGSGQGWWYTYKYRPILGIVSVGEGGEYGPEVAIVERPIWEADLPPRFYGDQEWEKKDL